MSADDISIHAVPDRLNQKAFWIRMLYGVTAGADLRINTSPERHISAKYSEGRVGAYSAQTSLDALGADSRNVYVSCVAATLILIRQYTAATDIMVGLPPRNWRGETPLDSCLLPLRYSFKPETTMGQLRQTVAGLIEEMYRNQDARRAPSPSPASPRPSADGWPRLSVAVAMVDGTDITQEPPDGGITIAVCAAANGFSLASKFDVRRFDHAGVMRLLDDVARIAECVVTDPDRLVLCAPAVSDETDAEEVEPPSNDLENRTIVDLFVEQVRRDPHKMAVVSDREEVDYLSLDAQSNRLASLLATSGLAGRTLVGLMAEPGANYVAAVLGILKSGGVCFPLDPTVEGDRLGSVLSGSGVQSLVVSARCLKAHGDVLGRRGQWGVIVCLDEDVEDPARLSLARRVYGVSELSGACSTDLDLASQADAPAFAYFAAGMDDGLSLSAASHATALDQASQEIQFLSRGVRYSALQTGAALSSENSWQIIAPLISGGVIVYCGDPQDSCQLLTALDQRQVSVVELSPYAVASLLDYAQTIDNGRRRLEALRLLIISGDTVSISLVNEWLMAYPNIPIVHTLRAFGGGCRTIIRNPISDERMLVPALNGHSKLGVKSPDGFPAPDGVPGEIQTVSKLLSAEIEDGRVSSLVSRGAPERWVKTGHCGKRILNGGVEWLGRLSDGETIGQLQERAELQSALSAHPGVRFCIVTRDGSDARAQRLVGHVLERRGAGLEDAALRAFAESLMVEAPDFDIRHVESFPLLPDGGVDCDALHKPVERDGLPRNPVDQALIGLWSEMLKTPSVSIHDDFFALGGHSVLAMQLTARIRRIFQAEVSLRSVFEAPTIAQISDIIARMEKSPGHAARLASIWLRTQTMSPEEIRELLRKAENSKPGGATAPSR